MFINEIILQLNNQMTTVNRLPSNRNTILLYSKEEPVLNVLYEPYTRSTKKTGTYRYYNEKYGKDKAEEIWKRGKQVGDLWFGNTRGCSKFYPSEKPFKLLERIICLSTK